MTSKARDIADLGSNDVLETSSTGLDVTGTVTADGLTVDGAIEITGNQAALALKELDTTDSDVFLRLNGGNFNIETRSDAGAKLGNRITADSNGDVKFFEDTGTTAKMVWDASAESLGIGTASPDSLLEIVGADPVLTIRDTETSGALTNATLRLAESGANNTVNNYWDINHTANNNLAFKQFNGASLSEVMRIDGSGNLLVGKTAANNNNVGIEAKPNGSFSAVADNITPVLIRRKTGDGTLLELAKDGTTVGSIGTEGNDLYIGNTNTALQFIDNTAGDRVIRPFDISTNSRSDNTTNLGYSNSRFIDLYLSGEVNQNNGGHQISVNGYNGFSVKKVSTISSSESGNVTRIAFNWYLTANKKMRIKADRSSNSSGFSFDCNLHGEYPSHYFRQFTGHASTSGGDGGIFSSSESSYGPSAVSGTWTSTTGTADYYYTTDGQILIGSGFVCGYIDIFVMDNNRIQGIILEAV